MTITVPKHPAKFTDSIIDVIALILESEQQRLDRKITVLDPMAGIGGIHALANTWIDTVGVELEPEWAHQSWGTEVGDATNLPDYWADRYDAVVTSPAYGNRMADHHNAKDDSKRMTYKHQLGRDLSSNSGAGLQWGGEYRELHQRILDEMIRVTKPLGLVIINVSNHIRKQTEEPVSEWWFARMAMAGLQSELMIPIDTPRMGFGQNAKARVAHEWIFVARKP